MATASASRGYNTVDVTEGSAKLVYEFADGEGCRRHVYTQAARRRQRSRLKPLTSPQNSRGGNEWHCPFTIPDKTFGGNTLEGDIKYLVRANGRTEVVGVGGERIRALRGMTCRCGSCSRSLRRVSLPGRSQRLR